MPVLSENMAYVQDYPISGNALNADMGVLNEVTSTSTQDAPEEPINYASDNEGHIIYLLQKYFPDNWEKMLEIAEHESTLDPKAYNPETHLVNKVTGETCKGSLGLLQVACSNYAGDTKDLFDLETNIKAARKVFDIQKYNAWGVCVKRIVIC